jgi:hypothetical protein
MPQVPKIKSRFNKMIDIISWKLKIYFITIAYDFLNWIV